MAWVRTSSVGRVSGQTHSISASRLTTLPWWATSTISTCCVFNVIRSGNDRCGAVISRRGRSSTQSPIFRKSDRGAVRLWCWLSISPSMVRMSRRNRPGMSSSPAGDVLGTSGANLRFTAIATPRGNPSPARGSGMPASPHSAIDAYGIGLGCPCCPVGPFYGAIGAGGCTCFGGNAGACAGRSRIGEHRAFRPLFARAALAAMLHGSRPDQRDDGDARREGRGHESAATTRQPTGPSGSRRSGTWPMAASTRRRRRSAPCSSATLPSSRHACCRPASCWRRAGCAKPPSRPGLRRSPWSGDIDMLCRVAQALAGIGETNAARACLQHPAVAASRSARALVALAHVHQGLGQQAEALALMERARALGHDDPDFHYYLALQLQFNGRLHEAEAGNANLPGQGLDDRTRGLEPGADPAADAVVEPHRCAARAPVVRVIGDRGPRLAGLRAAQGTRRPRSLRRGLGCVAGRQCGDAQPHVGLRSGRAVGVVRRPGRAMRCGLAGDDEHCNTKDRCRSSSSACRVPARPCSNASSATIPWWRQQAS